MIVNAYKILNKNLENKTDSSPKNVHTNVLVNHGGENATDCSTELMFKACLCGTLSLCLLIFTYLNLILLKS